MLTLTISETLTIRLYDSIKELPANLQLEAKQYAILQSALATTTEELASRKERVALLLQFDQQAEYQLEAYNYNLSERFLAEGYNPAELEWACYLYAINGEPVQDHSEDALRDYIKLIKEQGFTGEQIQESLGAINEQMLAETKRYYPKRVGKGKFNNLVRYRDYALALLEQFEHGTEESRAAFDRTMLGLLAMQKPINLKDSPENGLVALEKSQFKLYTTLIECGCAEPEKLTVFQFYGWIEVLEERSEQQLSRLNPPVKK
ncbi:hypothetical protein [Spirosoma endbachense]|uniref:Uncharacterized protein n=1 Tax=Spirosoma endbachense TaxID=2666025 RepID=A0A6P1VYW4_9BACT|nr:hypothetical protein [Spirosoma endbachense]QHV97292.1 hypothetical protein GJR95_20785 [Spirosoma endbachense]